MNSDETNTMKPLDLNCWNKNNTQKKEEENNNQPNETADGLVKLCGDTYFDPKTGCLVSAYVVENPAAKKIHEAREVLRKSQSEDPLFHKQEALRMSVDGEKKLPIEKVGKTGDSSTGEGPTEEQKELVKANIDEVLRPYYRNKYGSRYEK